MVIEASTSQGKSDVHCDWPVYSPQIKQILLDKVLFAHQVPLSLSM